MTCRRGSENPARVRSDGQLFSQSIGRANARRGRAGDYVDELRQKEKAGNDLSRNHPGRRGRGPDRSVTDFGTAKSALLKPEEGFTDLNLIRERGRDRQAGGSKAPSRARTMSI